MIIEEVVTLGLGLNSESECQFQLFSGLLGVLRCVCVCIQIREGTTTFFVRNFWWEIESQPLES